MGKVHSEKPRKLNKRKREELLDTIRELKEEGYIYPQKRADCKDGIRPCPHVLCKFNLFLEVEDDGTIRYNFPSKDPSLMKPVKIKGEEIYPSCTLDITDKYPKGLSNNDIGKLLGISRETVRLIDKRASAFLRSKMEIMGHSRATVFSEDSATMLDAYDQYLEETTDG